MNIQLKILDSRITQDMLQPATTGSAGIDLRACIDEKLTIKPGECVLVPSGIAIHINNPQYAAFIFPRSGLGHKHGLVLGNLTGEFVFVDMAICVFATRNYLFSEKTGW